MTIARSRGVKRAVLTGITIAASLGLSGPTAGVAAPPSADATAPPSEKITLDVVTVNGSGCPAGTANAKMLSDNTGFRITYSSFVAADGVGTSPTQFRQNCQVNVLVHIPQGYTYAVQNATYRGRASLRTGATALERTNYYFQGSPENNYADHEFKGPLSGSWTTHDVTATEDLVYAPCGVDRNLNINTELRVDTPSGNSWISLRSSEADVDTIVHFSWKQCN